jgi:hypothetical protein
MLSQAVPDLKEVKSFANHLHSLGKYRQGEIFGWQAEYTPEDSNMTFTPLISGLAKAESGSSRLCGSMARTKNLLSFWITVGL